MTRTRRSRGPRIAQPIRDHEGEDQAGPAFVVRGEPGQHEDAAPMMRPHPGPSRLTGPEHARSRFCLHLGEQTATGFDGGAGSAAFSLHPLRALPGRHPHLSLGFTVPPGRVESAAAGAPRRRAQRRPTEAQCRLAPAVRRPRAPARRTTGRTSSSTREKISRARRRRATVTRSRRTRSPARRAKRDSPARASRGEMPACERRVTSAPRSTRKTFALVASVTFGRGRSR